MSILRQNSRPIEKKIIEEYHWFYRQGTGWVHTVKKVYKALVPTNTFGKKWV